MVAAKQRLNCFTLCPLFLLGVLCGNLLHGLLAFASSPALSVLCERAKACPYKFALKLRATHRVSPTNPFGGPLQLSKAAEALMPASKGVAQGAAGCSAGGLPGLENL